ncbi:MAG: DUF3570 domain-containing protein [Candidatus Eisenbacteria bacterium]
MHVVAYLIASGVALAIPSFADPFEVEDQEATYLFRFFSDADKVHVSSHYGFYDVALQNDWKLGLRYNHEQVTVPGVAAPAGSAEAVDAITTASRPISGEDAYQDFTKVRNEVRATLDRGPAHVGSYVSKESDYFAQQVDGEWTQSLAQDNTYLSGGGSYGWDRITPLADQDTATPDDHRNTTHGSLILTQLLSATTVVRLGGELERVEGLQHNPYRNVYAGGGPVPERHPSTRNRRDAFLRLSQYFRNRSSVQIDYRYYTDDWGVQSQTVGAKLNQYVGPNVVVRYRYRYYDQERPTSIAPNTCWPTASTGIAPGTIDCGPFRRISSGHARGGARRDPGHSPVAAELASDPQLRAVFQRHQLLRERIRDRTQRGFLIPVEGRRTTKETTSCDASTTAADGSGWDWR